MKKVLFATTALVATAGLASAEVSMSGSAEMGIIGGDAYGNTTQFHGDLNISFTLSGQTDNGLTFGASISLDDAVQSGACSITSSMTTISSLFCHGAGQAFDATKQGGETIFVSGAFGTLTLGDTDGALDWANKEVNVVGGSIDDAETTHAGFNGNSGLDGTYDGQILRYDYSFGDFAVAGSLEIDDTGVGDPVYGIGFKYNTDFNGIKVGFGLGYQTVDPITAPSRDITAVSVNADFGNGFSGAINYSDYSGTGLGGKSSFVGVGAGYTMDALSVGVNYGSYDLNGGGTTDGYGLAVDYDLGGGAQVQFGYGSSSPNSGGTFDQYSLGLSMSF